MCRDLLSDAPVILPTLRARAGWTGHCPYASSQMAGTTTRSIHSRPTHRMGGLVDAAMTTMICPDRNSLSTSTRTGRARHTTPFMLLTLRILLGPPLLHRPETPEAPRC